MLKKVTIILLLLQALLGSITAQNNYPVYVTPSLNPPYSLKLSDYSGFGSQSLVVNITVNDLQLSNVPVKLRVKMETVGITIENPPTINTTPVYLDGGSTTILFGRDLEDYFNINNLIFKGYSKEAYLRTGQLPEGFYRFTVEVLHFQTNKLISNLGTASGWFALGKPPVLKLPSDDANLGEFKGTPIVFSWLPSNVGSPVSANSIQYKLELWEMRIDGISPYTVAASIPVFYETTTFNTQYSFNPASVMMEPGMRYAWRVTASDISGFVPFEQDGHSEMRTFVYKQKCEPADSLTAISKGNTAYFKWQPYENHTSYNVETQIPETGWLSKSETFDSKATFYDLDYNTTYELRIQAVCNGDNQSVSDFSEWASVHIAAQKPMTDSASCPDCKCEDNENTGEIENFEVKKDLKSGDTLVNRFGKTRYILKTVEPQGDGVYKGIFLFWAEIWNLKFVCEYWDLTANTENIVIDMDFESVYNPQFLLDIDATADYLNNLAGAISNLTPGAEIKDTLTINQDISTIYINEGDSVIVVTVDENGIVHEDVISDNTDNLENVLIQGEDGEEYVITKDGDVMGIDEYRNSGGKQNNLEDYNEEKEKNDLSEYLKVNFTASGTQDWGFDAYNEEKSRLQSNYIALDNGYRPAWKSVSSFSTDKVSVSPVNDKIIFRDEMGIPALLSGNELSVRGSYDGSEKALYAYQSLNDTTEKIVGKLNIVSYDKEIKKVYIVPVNGAKIPDKTLLEKSLNETYKQAVVKWQVEILTGVNGVVFENGNMTHGGSGAFSPYNSDQKAIVNAFTQTSELEADAFYLFYIDNVQNKSGDMAGYMPFQRQVGFIYDYPDLHAVAHELGHGAFNLRHTFSDDEFIASEGSTKNLMDYDRGTELWKNQWDKVQDPQKMWFAWAEDEEELESILDKASSIIELIRKAYLENSTCNIPLYGNTTIDNIYEADKDNTLKEEIAKKFKGLKIEIVIDPDFVEKKICEFHFNDIDIKEQDLSKTPINISYISSIWFNKKASSKTYITINSNKPVALLKEFIFGSIEKDCNDVIEELSKKIKEDETIDYNIISSGCASEIPLQLRQDLIEDILQKWWVSEEYEHALLVLLEQVKDEDVDDFIYYLRNTKLDGKYVYQQLMSHIHDEIGEDYYTALIQVFTRLLLRKSEYKNKEDVDFEEIILVGRKPWINLSQIPDYEIQYDNKPEYNEDGDITGSYKIRLLKEIGYVEVESIVGVFPQAKVETRTDIEKRYLWINDYQNFVLDPLSLVVLSQSSENENISDLLAEESSKGVLVPAAILMYNNDKILQQNIEKGCFVTLDVAATLLSGSTLIYIKAAGKAISRTRKILLYVEAVNGVLNLVVNTTELEFSPEVQKILLYYNLGTAAFNIACSSKNFKWIRSASSGEAIHGCENISEILIQRLSKYSESKRLSFFTDFKEEKDLLLKMDNLLEDEFDELMKRYDLDLGVDARKKVIKDYFTVKTSDFIKLARQEFDAYGEEWIKNNPFTGKEMFDAETGGYVVTHSKHNNNFPHEFTMAEAFAKNGEKVKLLSESAPIGVKTPDAEIIGEGIFDFKNINSLNSQSIEKNVHDYILNAKKQAENIAFNLKDNPVVTSENINNAVKNAIWTSKEAELLNIAEKVGVVYKNGDIKIIKLTEFDFENGIRF